MKVYILDNPFLIFFLFFLEGPKNDRGDRSLTTWYLIAYRAKRMPILVKIN